MADEEKPKGADAADFARQRFEEAQREFDDDAPKDNGAKRSSLRIVPLPKPEPWAAPSWLPTGEAVVTEVKRKYGDDFYHVAVESLTFHWNGKIWEIDQTLQATRLAAQLCREIGAAKAKKSIRNKVESTSFIRGVISRFRDEVSGPFERFDSADLICTPDAAIPLELPLTPREHRREDWCTKMTAVAAVAGTCAMWLTFLREITGGDNDMIDYLQRCAGYWATPFTGEQCFWFLYGSGGNGKGAFLRTIKRVLGPYAATASLDLFLATKFEQHSEELASLRGVRLVMATETEKGRAWNESKIKALTGGDSIRARFMRQNSFEYDPKFKIVVSGNHKPSIKSVDPAMARRLQLAPFEVEIPKAKQDDAFELKMFKEEGPAILAWILEGYQQWCEHGLSPPDRVISASEEYFVEQDALGQWIEDRCIVGNPTFFGFSSSLYQDWKQWAEANGVRVGSQMQFSLDLKKKHFDGPNHTTKGNGFFGIKLKPREDSYENFEPESAPKQQGMPSQITLNNKQKLRDLGYSEDDIFHMTPGEALDIINAERAAQSG